MNYTNFETLADADLWMKKNPYRNMRLHRIDLGRWKYRVYFDM